MTVEGAEYGLEDNPLDPDIQPLIVKGFVHPLVLRDSYALGLNIGCPEPQPNDKYQDLDIAKLAKFHPNSFLPNSLQSSLGQTLLITAKLTIAQKQKGEQFIRDLANQCVQNFIPQAYHNTLRLDRSGELFGSPIFEYGNPNHPETYLHVIVWLFSHPETEIQFGDCYQDFLMLFFYRHKVIKSYANSREVKIVIADDYQKIEEQINQINQLKGENSLSEEELKKLKIQLKELPKIALEYALMLRDLEDYRHTIALNDKNYLDTLDRIAEIHPQNYRETSIFPLIFLTKFSLKNSSYFQEQIQAKLGYFMQGSGLLDKAIASIRGIVEIDQAESDRAAAQAEKDRDRNLQITIAVVGVGIGVAGVTATAFPYYLKPADRPEKIDLWPWNYSPHPITQSISISLLIGLLASMGVWGLISLSAYLQKKCIKPALKKLTTARKLLFKNKSS